MASSGCRKQGGTAKAAPLVPRMRGFCVCMGMFPVIRLRRPAADNRCMAAPRKARRTVPMKMRGGKALLEQLKLHGVQVMFGYPGGAVIPLYDAIYEEEDIRHVLVR